MFRYNNFDLTNAEVYIIIMIYVYRIIAMYVYIKISAKCVCVCMRAHARNIYTYLDDLERKDCIPKEYRPIVF